jgi:hypothetical protein
MYRLAICAIFRDETPYLAEWIEFHRLMGVEHFFLYDNNSRDDPERFLEPWLQSGVVTLTPWAQPFTKGGQRKAYDHALAGARGTARWLAFLDIDEFLFAVNGDPLPEVLRDYDRYPGVVVNWQCYGTSGRVEAGEGLVIERFVRRAPTRWVRNRRVKSIVDPERAIQSIGPHFFAYDGDLLAVTENQRPVRVRRRSSLSRSILRRLASVPLVAVDPYAVRVHTAGRVSVSRLRINHYVLRSRDEFVAKRTRWHFAQYKNDRLYFQFHDRNDTADPVLCPYAPEVRRRVDAARRGLHP